MTLSGKIVSNVYFVTKIENIYVISWGIFMIRLEHHAKIYVKINPNTRKQKSRFFFWRYESLAIHNLCMLHWQSVPEETPRRIYPRTFFGLSVMYPHEYSKLPTFYIYFDPKKLWAIKNLSDKFSLTKFLKLYFCYKNNSTVNHCTAVVYIMHDCECRNYPREFDSHYQLCTTDYAEIVKKVIF